MFLAVFCDKLLKYCAVGRYVEGIDLHGIGTTMECPYINNNFSKCSQTLNIQNLGGAYDLCLDRYQQCPVYCKLREGNLTSSDVIGDSGVQANSNSFDYKRL